MKRPHDFDAAWAWLSTKFEWKNTFFMTCTFQPRFESSFLTNEIGLATLWKFKNKLNNMAFGNKSREERGGLSLPFLPVREGSAKKGWLGPHLHYHIIVGIPTGCPDSEWRPNLVHGWLGLDWGGSKALDVKKTEDEKVLAYMLKERTKDSSLLDCIEFDLLSFG